MSQKKYNNLADIVELSQYKQMFVGILVCALIIFLFYLYPTPLDTFTQFICAHYC